MKMFKVEVPVEGTEIYHIRANSEEEALNIVKNGDYDKGCYEIDVHSTDYDNADIYEE